MQAKKELLKLRDSEDYLPYINIFKVTAPCNYTEYSAIIKTIEFLEKKAEKVGLNRRESLELTHLKERTEKF